MVKEKKTIQWSALVLALMAIGLGVPDMLPDGTIDEIAIWNRTLTFGSVSVGQTAGGEIAELYNSGTGLQYPYVSGDDCDYSGSGDWTIDTACTIDSITDVQGNDIFINANVLVAASVSNYSNIFCNANLTGTANMIG